MRHTLLLTCPARAEDAQDGDHCADEIQQRTAAFMAQAPGQHFAGAVTAAGNGSGPPTRTGGNRDEGAPQGDGQAGRG